MNITIIKPGIQSSLQDFGKWGEQAFGVSIGGVMDPIAAKIANIICKNNEEAPVLEMTLHGTEILFNQDASIAITGSGSIPYINNIKIPFNKLIQVPRFSVLKTKPSAVGCRSYLAMTDATSENIQEIEISTWQINYAENFCTKKSSIVYLDLNGIGLMKHHKKTFSRINLLYRINRIEWDIDWRECS